MINVFFSVCKTKRAHWTENGTETGPCAWLGKSSSGLLPALLRRFFREGAAPGKNSLRSANACFTGFLPAVIETRGGPFGPLALPRVWIVGQKRDRNRPLRSLSARGRMISSYHREIDHAEAYRDHRFFRAGAGRLRPADGESARLPPRPGAGALHRREPRRDRTRARRGLRPRVLPHGDEARRGQGARADRALRRDPRVYRAARGAHAAHGLSSHARDALRDAAAGAALRGGDLPRRAQDRGAGKRDEPDEHRRDLPRSFRSPGRILERTSPGRRRCAAWALPRRRWRCRKIRCASTIRG